MRDLAGKVAVITGAAGGIGRALAQRLGQEKMRLILADINNERVNVVASHLDAQGVEVQTLKVDVSKAGQVDALADLAYARFGAVHLLCNNAGVAAVGTCWDRSLADWEWSLGVNLWGVIHGIRSFVPRMLAQNSEGHVVNTAAMAALLMPPLSAPYVAAKQAVIGVSECLHHDLALHGAKLRVSVACPGFVQTSVVDTARVRPADLAEPKPSVADPYKQVIDSYYSRGVAEGIDPGFVAAAIVDAVRSERFYVFTHPELQPRLEARFDRIVRGENPSTPPLTELGDDT